MIYVSKANTFIDKRDNNVEGFKTVNFKNMTLWVIVVISVKFPFTNFPMI